MKLTEEALRRLIEVALPLKKDKKFKNNKIL